MFVIIGGVIVLVGVLGGFVLEGGPILLLIQPAELLIIGGAAIGSILIATPLKVLQGLIGRLPGLLSGAGPSRATYTELLTLLYEIFMNAKKNGFISLDQDLSDPAKSPIFSKYPGLLKNHHARSFLCDSVRLLVDGSVTPMQLEELMDAEMETHHEEGARHPGLLSKVGDSLPGLGIVAAVLGVVITMQAINGPPEEIGHKVAVALVGTFIGILLCYGFVQPLAMNLEALGLDEGKFLQCIKAGVLAFANGSAPIVAVEFARRVIFSYDRPDGPEVESLCKEIAAR
ncbi:MAG TPA: flagellar motor stator protein MotA [Candidatus Methylomirabilis sp.]|nr:flagellar motor stator protein MotA [Candidatus Methylomirabilis sp.]